MRSDFRRSVAIDTKKKPAGNRNFFERFRLPKDISTPFALIDAIYDDPENPLQKTPYFKFNKHVRVLTTNGKSRYADEICSAGYDKSNPKQCMGCAAMDNGDKTVNLSTNFALGIVHLTYYHGHPVLSKDSSSYLQSKEGGLITNFEECKGRLCNFCRVLRGEKTLDSPGNVWNGYMPQDITTIFGRRRYMELGKGHLADLQGWDEIIGSQCGNCRRPLTTNGFNCPFCNTLVINMANDQRTDSEIKDITTAPYPCLQCQKAVLLNEVVSCENCARQGKQEQQLSVFEVVLYGMRQGEQTKSHLVQGQPHATFEEFETGVAKEYLAGRTIKSLITELGEPYDFKEMLAPRAITDQAKKLEVSLASTSGSQPYQPSSSRQPNFSR